MDRLATAIVIAAAVLLTSSGLLVRDVLADDAVGRMAAVVSDKSPAPVVNGLRSERVLSLVLTLEALRAAPALLDARKA